MLQHICSFIEAVRFMTVPRTPNFTKVSVPQPISQQAGGFESALNWALCLLYSKWIYGTWCTPIGRAQATLKERSPLTRYLHLDKTRLKYCSEPMNGRKNLLACRKAPPHPDNSLVWDYAENLKNFTSDSFLTIKCIHTGSLGSAPLCVRTSAQ